MIQITKCSLNGISAHIDSADTPYMLGDQTSYLPANYHRSDAEIFWHPSQVSFESYSVFCMAYYPSAKGSNRLEYAFDIKDADDYICAFKLNKRYGFNPVNMVSISLSYPTGENLDTVREIRNLEISNSVNSLVVISLQHNMAQVVEDSVWVSISFSALVPGRYVVSISAASVQHFRFLSLWNSIFFLEAVTAFKQSLFSEEGLFLANGVQRDSFTVRSHRVIDIEDSHPYSRSTFLSTLRQGQARVSAQLAYEDNGDFMLLGGFCSFSLEDFSTSSRYVNSFLNAVNNIPDENLSQLSRKRKFK